ncbi:MAG: ABC transporter permease [Candidatus Competibacteraceae bacterium]
MELLLFYSLRNLLARRLTTLLTAGGMGLVVFVFAAIIMLAEGLQQTLVDTGSYENAVIIRRSSETEMQSTLYRDQAGIVESQPEVALGQDGRPLVAREVVVLIALPKRGSASRTNVIIRGISPSSLALRPQIKLLAGRLPQPGSTEIIVGQSVAQRFQGVELGASLNFATRNWTIVGIFDAGKTGFSSEIWGDVDQLMQAFRRPVYSSILFRLRDPSRFPALKQRIENDPRLTLEAYLEPDYYRKQSEMMATFLRILGLSLTLIFSFGAVVGAMITMYAAVSNRTTEIGTLRALGFQRSNILLAFLMESLFLGFLGGVLGLLCASVLQLISVSTTNFQTFSELAFSFVLTPRIIIQALAFALIMGLLGGILPAIRAARMNLVDSLREA